MSATKPATNTQQPIEMNLMEIYRGYSIREQPLGFTVEGINCHSAPTIESARKAIDCYIDGDKNPQMRGIMESLVSHAISATKPQHTPERTQPCLEQWLLMSENVRDEYRREGFYDPSALIDPLPLLAQRDALAEIVRKLVALCPSSEGLGGHAPLRAFLQLGEEARAALAAAGL